MAKPREGTPEYELWLCATDVAIAAPWKHGKYVHSAQVPWDDIERLRAALEAVGVDWRAGKQRDDERVERVRAERAARVAARMMTGLSHPPIPPEES
jgi:hypothetical protein